MVLQMNKSHDIKSGEGGGHAMESPCAINLSQLDDFWLHEQNVEVSHRVEAKGFV